MGLEFYFLYYTFVIDMVCDFSTDTTTLGSIAAAKYPISMLPEHLHSTLLSHAKTT